MVKFTFAFACMLSVFGVAAQPKTELYDFIKKFLYDSTGYSNVGDWGVGTPKKFPVAWKADKIEMSNDTSINFYRTGTANITIGGKTFMQQEKPVKWTMMLKGPRMGYVSFSLISTASKEIPAKYTIDSLFGNKPYKATLLKSCDKNAFTGFYYYEVKIPKKDMAYIKFSWFTLNGNTAMRVDVYDSWSKYAVKLDCPKG